MWSVSTTDPVTHGNEERPQLPAALRPPTARCPPTPTEPASCNLRSPSDSDHACILHGTQSPNPWRCHSHACHSLQSVLRSFPSPLVASSEPVRIALVQSEMQIQILLDAFLFIRETCAAGLKAMMRRLESMCPNLRGVVADILTWFSVGTPPIKSIPTEHLKKVTCIDVHPTEPWILTGHQEGNVCIWKTKPQDGSHEMVSIKKHKYEDYCVTSAVRFVARRQWVIVGDNYGDINVYEYDHKTLVKTMYRAHQGQVRSLAVHPTHPYLLSSSDDKSIKLWNWDNKWEQIREFKGHLSPVLQVMFSPKDTSQFASVSDLFVAKSEMRRTLSYAYSGSPTNIKVWNIDSGKSESYNFSESFTAVDFCLTDSDQQYLVVCKKDGNAEIRERANGQVKTLETPLKTGEVITAVASHPSLPILVAGTQFGRVFLWNLTTHRLEKEHHFHNGWIEGFGFMDVERFNRACDWVQKCNSIAGN
ncbi:hypothetical protein ACP70R_048144 [Stipagrostis hirtigluma subsp. patula]